MYGSPVKCVRLCLAHLKLSCLFTIYCNDTGLGHIFLSLCRNWHDTVLHARMIVPNCAKTCRGEDLIEAVPSVIGRFIHRVGGAPEYLAERRFLKDLDNFDAVYLSPYTSLRTLKRVKQSGRLIFLERVNCYAGETKQILDQAYA